MSNKRTLQLLSAASAAIPAPIVPEPKTATEFISLFISIPFYYLSLLTKVFYLFIIIQKFYVYD